MIQLENQTQSIVMQPDQEALLLNERIRANGQAAVNAVCAVGRDLRRMKIEELYRYLNYSSFEEYAEQEHGLKRRQAYQYISVYENLGEAFVQSNAQLGITKLSLLTQINQEERAEIMEDNDLSGMTVSEVKALLEKVKQQGEQLSMFEEEKQSTDSQTKELEEKIAELKIKADKADMLSARLDDMNQICTRISNQRDKAESKVRQLENTVEELEKRPVEVAVSEPEIKEVVKEIIKEVPDKKAIEEKNREIADLQSKCRDLDKAKTEEIEKIKRSYEERIAQLPELQANSEKSSFKLLYAEAYKSCLGLIEFIESSEIQERERFIERTEKLLEVIKESIMRSKENLQQ